MRERRQTLRCAECGALAFVLVSDKPLCWKHFDEVIGRQVEATTSLVDMLGQRVVVSIAVEQPTIPGT